jgi:2-polyprenyl-3-methyl-5-hydroxy-6-metoxy-1,4-benzoquinol methylase
VEGPPRRDRMSARAPSAPLSSPFDDAELYDQIFRDFGIDLEFWREQAKRAGGPVLEVACGTGRVALEMAQAGADVDGFDLSEPMLERLRAKCKERGLRVHATRADMRDFHMARRYALIAIPFNSFLHNLTQHDQLLTLRVCREHLLPGGVLVMHLSFFAPEIIAASGGEPVLELETVDPATGHTLQHYDHRTMDPIEQVQHSINEVREVDERGETVSVRETETRVRWIGKPELELLLTAAGFERRRIDGGFDGKTLESAHDQMIVFAWKGGA